MTHTSNRCSDHHASIMSLYGRTDRLETSISQIKERLVKLEAKEVMCACPDHKQPHDPNPEGNKTSTNPGWNADKKNCCVVNGKIVDPKDAEALSNVVQKIVKDATKGYTNTKVAEAMKQQPPAAYYNKCSECGIYFWTFDGMNTTCGKCYSTETVLPSDKIIIDRKIAEQFIDGGIPYSLMCYELRKSLGKDKI